MDMLIEWMFEHWLIEAICIIMLSFIIGMILGHAMSCINGDK